MKEDGKKQAGQQMQSKGSSNNNNNNNEARAEAAHYYMLKCISTHHTRGNNANIIMKQYGSNIFHKHRRTVALGCRLDVVLRPLGRGDVRVAGTFAAADGLLRHGASLVRSWNGRWNLGGLSIPPIIYPLYSAPAHHSTHKNTSQWRPACGFAERPTTSNTCSTRNSYM